MHFLLVLYWVFWLFVVSFSLSSFSVVGFSGSRSPSPAALAAVGVALSRVSSSAAVLVGCAAGVDQAVRQSRSRAVVFSAAQFGSGRGSFAARSVAFVRSLASSGGCLGFVPVWRLPWVGAALGAACGLFLWRGLRLLGFGGLGGGFGCAGFVVCGSGSGLGFCVLGSRLVAVSSGSYAAFVAVVSVSERLLLLLLLIVKSALFY
ncbi:hypothetical protein [Synechococcus elongatus]|uniref:hypothetical protein n=1 Tax=Synechococcus elongatus TaxID=32046 RepID=UPI0030D1F82F